MNESLKMCNGKLRRTVESRKDSGTVETQDQRPGLKTDVGECVNTPTSAQGINAYVSPSRLGCGLTPEISIASIVSS
jgi:hypothetical protein